MNNLNKIIYFVVMVVLLSINQVSTGKSLNDSPLVFIQNKRIENKPSLTIAERINSIPDCNFQVCGGIPKDSKLSNSPEAPTGRIINNNDNIQIVEAKNNNNNNKKYKYIFKEDVGNPNLKNKYGENDLYRTHWAYPKKPKSLKGKDTQFGRIACNEIIIDVDGDNEDDNYHLEAGLTLSKDIMELLNDKFPELNINIYYSGLKGFHVAISLDKQYTFDTQDIGKTANVVVFYHNLIEALNKKLNVTDRPIKLDNSLGQVTRLIQLAERKKNDGDKERGYKVCIANSKTVEFPSIDEIKTASQNCEHLANRLRNNKSNNVSGFINWINTTLTKPIAIDKPIKNHGKPQSKISSKHNNTNTSVGNIQAGLNPILNELNKKYQQDGHQNIRSPILYTVKHYLPDLEDALPFIDFFMQDKRHGTRGNTREGLINAFNEGKPNQYAVYHKLGIIPKKRLPDKRTKEGKEIHKENDRLLAIYYSFRDWLEDYSEEVKHDKIIKQGKEFLPEVTKHKNNLIDWYSENLPEYLGKQNHKNLIYGNMCSLAVNMGTLLTKYNIEGDAEGGKDEYCNMLEGMNPNFRYIGTITASAFYRIVLSEGVYAFDRTVIYLGDKTLKTQSQKDLDAFNEIEGTIGELVTRGEKGISKIISAKEGEGTVTLLLKASGLMQINTGTYINNSPHGAGRQKETRTISIAIDPITDKQIEQLYLRDDITAEKEHQHQQEFMSNHKAYQLYIKENPINIKLSNDIKQEILTYAKHSNRALNRTTAIFKAYCNFIRVEEPTIDTWLTFKEILPINTDLNPIESEFFETIIKGTISPFNLFCQPDTIVETNDIFDNLLSKNNKKKKVPCFFTVSGLRSYRRDWFNMNKNLKDVIDKIPEMLKNLESKGYIERIDTTSERGENIYYYTVFENENELE